MCVYGTIVSLHLFRKSPFTKPPQILKEVELNKILRQI